MPEQIVKQRSRGFICVTAHPGGCARNVEQQIEAVKRNRPESVRGPRNVLVIGSSTGYGLATRIAAAWGFGAKTVGVFYERPPDGRKTASAGYYNTAAFHRLAREQGLYATGINGDAFSDDVKSQVVDLVRADIGKLDLVVYSLAAPRRVHPRTGEAFQTVLKTIGGPYRGKTVDFTSGAVTEVTIEAADEEEIAATIAVMGGEDWWSWIDTLREQDLLAEGARTLAYSYVGPKLTWPIYRQGTIGAAKKDLEQTAADLNAKLVSQVGGGAWVSVNKAVVTQASVAIPVVPLYISLLLRVMKQKGVHEGCIEQMQRLCFSHLADGKEPSLDGEGLIRLDDLELRDDIQTAVAGLWEKVSTENLEELSDIAVFRREFNNLFGFHVKGVDYGQPTETDIEL